MEIERMEGQIKDLQKQLRSKVLFVIDYFCDSHHVLLNFQHLQAERITCYEDSQFFKAYCRGCNLEASFTSNVDMKY